MRILLVDDCEDMLTLMLTYTEIIYPKASILLLDNGKKALEICKQKEFDLIITDMEMPVMSGVEFARELKNIRPNNNNNNIHLWTSAMYEDSERLFQSVANKTSKCLQQILNC